MRLSWQLGTWHRGFGVLGLALGLCGLHCAEGNSSGDAECGNLVIEAPEQCDGYDLGGADCTTLNMGTGQLKCGYNCQFDVSACSNPFLCGNGAREGTEYCDGADLGFATCESLNLGTGTLACTAQCTFDTSGCSVAEVCGNGVVEGTEDCDGYNLDGQSCLTIGQGYNGGTLACDGTCVFDDSGCTEEAVCGNGIQEGTEKCDGADLGGFTCVNLGYPGGNLACTASCQFDTTACTQTAEICDNNVDDDGDTYVDCADVDCSSDPYCGGSPENCANGVDDDQDGLFDCDDPDCSGDPSCPISGEICDNGIDDDGWLGCDCGDIQCWVDLWCLLAPSTETNCTDGVDDDLDCAVDCADSDCAADPACTGGPICDQPTPINCGDTLSGNTSGGLTHVQSAPGCYQAVADVGPEAYFIFTPSAGGSVTVDLVGQGSADLDLIVVGESGGDCDPTNSCIGFSQASGGTESVTFTATAGTTYYFIVDGWQSADSGAFDISVTCQ